MAKITHFHLDLRGKKTLDCFQRARDLDLFKQDLLFFLPKSNHRIRKKTQTSTLRVNHLNVTFSHDIHSTLIKQHRKTEITKRFQTCDLFETEAKIQS